MRMRKRTIVIPTKTDPLRRPRVQCAPVLIVLSGDGTCQVYADRHVDVHIVTLLHADDNPKAEILAEQFLELEIPRRYRNLYWPVNLRASDTCRKRTVAGEIEARRKLKIIHGLRALREAYSK